MLTTQEIQTLEDILESPDLNPLISFPLTRTFPIDVPGFSQVFLKDESTNPTGTHKDRFAYWATANLAFWSQFEREASDDVPFPHAPHFSMISSGSGAIAVQYQLKRYGLPNLKVLMDHGISRNLTTDITHLGGEIYFADLKKRKLLSKDILRLTKNNGGVDLTSFDLDTMGEGSSYSFLSFEILNSKPEFVFVPYGTGRLYESLLNVAMDVVIHSRKDEYLKAGKRDVRKCNFIGATSNNPKTKADKLYARYRPFTVFSNKVISRAARSQIWGDMSGIREIDESYLVEAQRIADSQIQPIVAEPSGLSGLALLLQMRDQIPNDARIVIVNTGKTKLPYGNTKSLSRYLH